MRGNRPNFIVFKDSLGISSATFNTRRLISNRMFVSEIASTLPPTFHAIQNKRWTTNGTLSRQWRWKIYGKSQPRLHYLVDLSIYISLYLSICIYPPIHLATYLSIYLFIYLSVYSFINISAFIICLSIHEDLVKSEEREARCRE